MKYFDERKTLKKEYYHEGEYNESCLNDDAISNSDDARLFLEEVNECNKDDSTKYFTAGPVCNISAKADPEQVRMLQFKYLTDNYPNIYIKNQKSLFEILIILMKDYVDKDNKFRDIRIGVLEYDKLILSVINHVNEKLDSDIVDLVANYMMSRHSDAQMRRITLNCLKKHCTKEDKLKLDLLYGGI